MMQAMMKKFEAMMAEQKRGGLNPQKTKEMQDLFMQMMMMN
jgi:hypothetical protein